jgi:hypothetical protein
VQEVAEEVGDVVEVAAVVEAAVGVMEAAAVVTVEREAPVAEAPVVQEACN